MRLLLSVAAALFAGFAYADDKAKPFEFAGMKSATPGDWKEEPPSNNMRMAQLKLPKAEGDKEDGELAFFVFPGGAGTREANLKRQVDKFVEQGRKDKSEKITLGGLEGTYQDVSGTFKKKAFPMATDFTAMSDYRQLYVLFEG